MADASSVDNTADSAQRKPFPHTQDELVNDDRCAWSTESNSWVLEDHTTGTEWEWNPKVLKWTQLANEDDLARLQSAYKMPGVDETEPAVNPKKRKNDEGEAKESKKIKEGTKEVGNRAIYISNLPLQATEQDIADRFKKYGVLALEPAPDGGERARITMYRDQEGNFKGDALLVYEKEPSVQNAIMLADETDLYDSFGNANMRVQAADMSYKKEKTLTSGAPIKKAQRSKQDVERYKEIAAKQRARLGEWDDDDPQSVPVQPAKPRLSQHVVCENFFTFESLKAEGQELLDDIDSMVRDEAKTNGWGDILRLTIYDLEPKGIVMIKFETPELAEKAASALTQWKFDGRQLHAFVSTKKEKFRKTWKPKADIDNGDDEAARLEAFGRELEAEGAPDASANGEAQ